MFVCVALVSENCVVVLLFFFFKQKTAYEMRISDWSSDVCSSDLLIEIKGQGSNFDAVVAPNVLSYRFKRSRTTSNKEQIDARRRDFMRKTGSGPFRSTCDDRPRPVFFLIEQHRCSHRHLYLSS